MPVAWKPKTDHVSKTSHTNFLSENGKTLERQIGKQSLVNLSVDKLVTKKSKIE